MLLHWEMSLFWGVCHTLEMLTTTNYKNRNMFVVCLLTICVFVRQVAARAGVYDILNHLGFSEFENPRDTPLARMRCRWQQQNIQTLPFRGKFIWETTTVTELCFSEWNTFTVTQQWFLYLLMWGFFFPHHWFHITGLCSVPLTFTLEHTL